MRLTIISLTASLLTAACSTAPDVNLEDRTLPYGCNDVVVVGSVQNGSFELARSPNDLLGHGWATATITVRKVVKGPLLPSVLPVRYFAHTYMRQNLDFMLVLKRTDGGGYEISTGQLMSLRPRLTDRCT